MPGTMRKLSWIGPSFLALACGARASRPPELTVYAAASLRDVLHELAAEGLIEVQGRSVAIPSVARLQQYAL